jgi:hypothetical protein
MWNLTRRHPDDEALVAHLDGELAGRAGRKLEEHLRSCWHCRSRLAGFEEQIRALALARASRAFPGEVHRRASFERFQDRFHALISEAALDVPDTTATPVATPPRWPLRAIWSVAAALPLLLATLWFQQPVAPPPNPPAELAAVRQVELALLDAPQPLHQVLRVEMAANLPAARAMVSRLEVWSDRSSQRYSSRWENEAGEVRCALWRPASGQEHSYFRETRQNASYQTLFLAGLEETTLEDFERGFLRWIDSNRWRPVSLSAEMAHLESLDGVSLQMRRTVVNGRPTIELTARRSAPRGATQAVLLVDAATHRPHSLTLRYGSHSLRLVNDLMETISPALLPAMAFQPAVPQRFIPTRGTGVARLPALRDLDSSEVQALYALHQAGACLGEPVQVSRQPSGRIVVSGQVSTLGRRRALERELASIPYLAVELRSPEESAGDPARPVAHSLEIRAGGSAMADRLGQVRASEVSDRAVTSAQAAMLEAWALRRLAEWAEPEKMERLSPEARRLVGLMGRTHAETLRREIQEQHAVLRPILGGSDPGSAVLLPPDWQTTSLRVFGSVEQSERLTLTLFARPGSSPRQTDEAVRALWDAVSRAGREIEALDARLAAAFSK